MPDAATRSSPIGRLLRDFQRRRPIRAGSLIVTIYGDAIAPRGGSLWLGSLLEMMAAFDVEPGLVRTAMSRLVTEGWFERRRCGRKSFYRLSPRGAADFADATRLIYHMGPIGWLGGMEVAVLLAEDARRRAAARDQLARHGWGQAAPNVMLRPVLAGGSVGPAARVGPGDGDAVVMRSRLDPDDGGAARRLAGACWQLDSVKDGYQRFIDAFAPFEDGRGGRADWSDGMAFQLRILLIHEFRRVILRDPLLPPAMLPADWQGDRARALCRQLYRRTRAGAERWLDAHAVDEAGPLPPAGAGLADRFERP